MPANADTVSKPVPMNKLGWCVLVFAVGTSCGRSERSWPEPSFAVKAEATCEGPVTDQYLPGRAFHWLATNSSPSEQAGTILAAMREQPLACGNAPDSYRLLWLHSFSSWPPERSNYPPTMIRLSRDADGWTATGVRLASSVNRVETDRRVRKMTPSDVAEMTRSVEVFQLWTRKDYDYKSVDDGAMWVVEGRRGTAYHPVVLINADRETVAKLAVLFARLAGLDPGRMDPGNDK